MIELTADQRTLIQNILTEHVPHAEIRVYGSRITGKHKPYSDIDLAIVGTDKLPPEILFALREDLEESDLPFRVDLLDWHTISAEFKANIEARFEVL